MELKYANENKTKNSNGWVLDFDFLLAIQKKVESERYEMDLEDIEAVLLATLVELNLQK